MKQIKKLGCLLVTLMLLATTLIGCVNEQDDLYKAYFGEYKSGKMNMKMGVKLNQPLPAEWDPTGIVATTVNKTNLDLNATYETNNKDALKMYANVDVNGLDEVTGMSMKGIKLWMDFNIKDKAIKGNYIYELPTQIAQVLELPANMKYLYMDFGKLFEGQNLPEELFNFTPEQSQKMTKEMLKEMGTSDIKPVLKDGVYTITFTKAQMTKAFVGMMDYSMKTQQPMLEEMKKDLTAEEKAEFDVEYAKVMKQVKDAISKMDIFADEAAVVKITLDENKLMKTMDLTVNIKADIEKIQADFMKLGEIGVKEEAKEEVKVAKEVAKEEVKVAKEVATKEEVKATKEVAKEEVKAIKEEVKVTPATKQVIDMSINLTYTYSDTNKPVEIKLPTLTKENSMNMMDQILGVATTEEVEVAPVKVEEVKKAPVKK